jgi:hypothetical protein
MNERRSSLTVVSEISGIVGMIIGVAGIALTIYYGSVLSGGSAAPAISHPPSHVAGLRPSISASPARSYSPPSPSSSPTRTISSPPTAQPEVSHTSEPVSAARTSRHDRSRLNLPDSIGILIALSFWLVMPVFGLLLRLTGLPPAVRGWLMFVPVTAAVICYGHFVHPLPGAPFRYFVLAPLWIAEFTFGCGIYIGIASKLDRKHR